MCRIKAKFRAGPIKEERIASIDTASGEVAEVILGASQAVKGGVEAVEICRDEKGRVLVELPRETSSGAWRVWVEPSQLLRA